MSKLLTNGVHTFDRDMFDDVRDELDEARDDGRISSSASIAAALIGPATMTLLDDENMEDLEPTLTVVVDDDVVTAIRLEDNMGIMKIESSKY